MNLLIVSPIFPPEIGGPASYVSGLAERLKHEHQLRVITFSRVQAQTHSEGYSLTRVSTKGTTLQRQLRLLKTLLSQSRKVEVIYGQGTIVVGVAAWLASTLLRKRLVIKFVGDEVWEPLAESGEVKQSLELFYKKPPRRKLPIIWLHRFILHQAHKVIVPSAYLQNFLVTFHQIPKEKVTVIPNAVEIPAGISSKKKPYQLLFVGRLVPWKHVDVIIKAIALARQKHPWQLTIVGDGNERKNLQKLTEKLQANSWVTFAGKLDKQKTLQHIANAQKLILYSSYEGQPHTLLEAMMLDTTIVASDIPPHRELFGDTTQLVSLHNPEALAAAINASAKALPHKLKQKTFQWDSHVAALSQTLIN